MSIVPGLLRLSLKFALRSILDKFATEGTRPIFVEPMIPEDSGPYHGKFDMVKLYGGVLLTASTPDLN